MVRALSLILVSTVTLSWTLAASSDPGPSRINGDYLEVRTSDVWTGPCFANGEMNLVGKEALLAWQVREGDWKGVGLEGLRVVAVVRANTTLGDPFGEPLKARSLLLLDARAGEAQKAALADFAREMGGPLLENVVSVESTLIDFVVDSATGEASLKAGETVEMKTRALNHHDMHCGNEFEYYPPLTETSARPAFALAHRYSGDGLGARWSNPGKRSAYIGTFNLGGADFSSMDDHGASGHVPGMVHHHH